MPPTAAAAKTKAPGNVTTDSVSPDMALPTINVVRVSLFPEFVERNGSRVEFRTLAYENPGSNPVLIEQTFQGVKCKVL